MPSRSDIRSMGKAFFVSLKNEISRKTVNVNNPRDRARNIENAICFVTVITNLVLKVKTIYFQETIVEKKEITRGSLS